MGGAFQNLLGSDVELANFYELGDDLPTKMHCDNQNISTNVVAFSKKYIAVKHQIEKHYTRWKTWLAEVYNTHFNTPWDIIAVSAASLINPHFYPNLVRHTSQMIDNAKGIVSYVYVFVTC